MPLVRSLTFKYAVYWFKLIAIILFFNKIISIYSCYTKKGLVYIIIIGLFSYKPFSYTKYIKLNIYSSCNI